MRLPRTPVNRVRYEHVGTVASPARASIVRAQEIAQRACHNYIGAEHIAYALTQSDGEVGRLMAGAVDRAAIEAMWNQSGAIAQEMVFAPGAKRVIEIAFENARRIGDSYVGEKHIALGLLDTTDPPPLLPGTDVAALRTALTAVAETPNMFTKVVAASRWRRRDAFRCRRTSARPHRFARPDENGYAGHAQHRGA